jgi:AcrR family transcriptional regulator
MSAEAGQTIAEPSPEAGVGRRRRRRSRDQARSALIRSALELADTSSFRDLTVDQIATRAGLSRSAFYIHFRDKPDLLLAAVEEVAGELYRMAERWWSGGGPPAERVREAISGVVSVYAEHAGVLRIAAEVSTYDEEVREAWRAIVDRFIEAGAEHIRSEQAKSLVPAAMEPEATAEALVWMAERHCYIYLARGERTASEVVAALASVWTAALYPGVVPAEELRPETSLGEADRSRGAPSTSPASS